MKKLIRLIILLLGILMVSYSILGEEESHRYHHQGTNNYVFNRGAIRNHPGYSWDYEVHSAVYHAPIVVDGYLYFGDSQGYFYKIDITDGYQVWKYNHGAAIPFTPTYWDNRVFFVSEDQTLSCIDIELGEKLWQRQLLNEPVASCFISNGHIIVSLSDSVSRWNPVNGEQVWKNDKLGTINTCPAVSRGRIYLSTAEGNIIAIKEGDGDLIWSIALSSVIQSNLVLSDERIFFIAGNQIVTLEEYNGVQLWRRRLYPSRIIRPIPDPLIKNNLLIIGNRVFHPGSGDNLWNYWGRGDIMGDAVIVNDILYLPVTNHFERLYGVSSIEAVSLTEQRNLFTVQLSVSMTSPILILNKKLFFFADNNKLYCYQ